MNKKVSLIPEVGFTALGIKRGKYEEKVDEKAVRLEGMNYAKKVVIEELV